MAMMNSHLLMSLQTLAKLLLLCSMKIIILRIIKRILLSLMMYLIKTNPMRLIFLLSKVVYHGRKIFQPMSKLPLWNSQEHSKTRLLSCTKSGIIWLNCYLMPFNSKGLTAKFKMILMLLSIMLAFLMKTISMIITAQKKKFMKILLMNSLNSLLQGMLPMKDCEGLSHVSVHGSLICSEICREEITRLTRICEEFLNICSRLRNESIMLPKLEN